MDEQIQSILDQATTPQGSQPTESGDPVNSILQSAGITSQAPEDVSLAEQQAQAKSQDDNGYCQRFVEKITGSKKHYGSAVQAWNDYVKQGKAFADISKAPPGSLLYYAPDAGNRGFGHVAVTDGNGNQIGATYHGVQQDTTQNWLQKTGQTPLGFVMP